MRSFFFLFVLSSLAVLTVAPPAPAQVALPGIERSKLDPGLAGRVWIEELNCVACHESAANGIAESSRKAPRLAGVGGRGHPDFLRAFIADSYAAKPGTLMPDLLDDLAETDSDRKAAAEAITHYLVSLNPGPYDPEADYDKLKPVKTLKLESFGGVKPTPYPGGGTRVVRGFILPKSSGVYEFRPGYGGSTHNLMEVGGVEVYRKEVGNDAAHRQVELTEGRKVPFKITYLTEQANGLGWIARMDIPGTLATVVKQDGKFPCLVDEAGKWTERKDVWYKGVVTAGANKWLSIGCGAGANNIGPELGFGHVIGDYHDEPVLILKASQGNRSLGWDFLPPGSERFEHEGKIYAGYQDSPASWDKGTKPKPINWYAGKQYDDCFQAAHQVLENFASEFPQFEGRGYEISPEVRGFIQDQCLKGHGAEKQKGDVRLDTLDPVPEPARQPDGSGEARPILPVDPGNRAAHREGKTLGRQAEAGSRESAIPLGLSSHRIGISWGSRTPGCPSERRWRYHSDHDGVKHQLMCSFAQRNGF